MATVATSQITIMDVNDVLISSTEPGTKVLDMLWFDTSITPPALKRWNGSAWVSANITPEEYNALMDVATNFNTRNDRNATTPTKPTIPGTGTAIDHTIATDGSATISFEWTYPASVSGTGSDIDGFNVFVYSSTSSASYAWGTSPNSEQVFKIPSDRRAFIYSGVPADLYYTFGVQAYREVDNDIVASGVLSSAIAYSTWTGTDKECPYRPSSTVAFSGNITGTIAGTGASTLVAWAASGATAATIVNTWAGASPNKTLIDGGQVWAGSSITIGSADPVTGTGHIKSGKANYADDTSGFFMGKESGKTKFSIGNALNSLKWDEATGTVTLTGALNIRGGGVQESIISAQNSGGKIYTQNTDPYPLHPTFQRSSTAYKLDGTTVAANIPRIEQGKFGQAILLEEATTNLFTNPLMETTTGWSPSNGGTLTAVTSGASTAGLPTGVTSYLKGTRTIGNPDVHIYQSLTLTCSASYALSSYVYVPSSVTGSAYIGVWYSVSGAWNGLTTQTITERDVWVRKTLGFVANPTYSTHIMGVGGTSSMNEGACVYACRAQLENWGKTSSFASPSRIKDVCYIETKDHINDTEGTIEGWLKLDPQNYDITGRYRPIFCTDIDLTNRLLVMSYYNRIYVWNNGEASLGSTIVHPYNEWFHFAVTWNSSGKKIYQNGELVASNSDVTTPVLGTYGYIGYRPTASLTSLGGLLDSLKISNIARSESEIFNYYNSQTPLEKDVNTLTLLQFNTTDTWVDTSSSQPIIKSYDGTKWIIGATVGAPSGTYVGGQLSQDLVAAAADGLTAFNDTYDYRNDSPPTNNGSFTNIATAGTSDGNSIIRVDYDYTQGAVRADHLLIYVKEGGGTITSDMQAYPTNPVSGLMRFVLKPSITYSFGIQAVKSTLNGASATAIITSSNIVSASGNYTGSIGGTSATTLLYNATAALTGVADIASDNKLTGGEKQLIAKEWEGIYAEKQRYVTQANSFGLAADLTAYTTAYSNLAQYLNNGSAWTESATVPPSWINSTNITTTIVISGAVLRSTFKTYYDERQIIANKIHTKASQLSLWTGVTGPGRPADYATQGKSLGLPFNSWYLNGNTIETISDGKVGNIVLRLCASGAYPNQGNFIPIDYTKTYRTRFWARPSSDNTAGLLYFLLRQFTEASSGNPGPNNSGRSPYKPSGISRATHNAQYGIDQWGEYSYTWTSADWQTDVMYVQPEFLDNYSSQPGYWDIQDFTFEEVTEVIDAKTTAQQAVNDLADIASDSQLTASEKQRAKLEWDTIQAEKIYLDDQVKAYLITTEKTDYDTSYTNLSSYITPLLADLEVTSAVSGAEFRGKFTDYYIKRQALQKRIIDIGNAYNSLSVPADAELFSYTENLTGSKGTGILTVYPYTRRYGEGAFGQNCIALDEGTTNLLRSSGDLSNATYWAPSRCSVAQVAVPQNHPIKNLTSTVSKVTFSGVADPLVVQSYNLGVPVSGKTYTVSAWMWIDEGQQTEATMYVYDGTVTYVGSKIITLTTTPTRYSLTYTFPAAASSAVINGSFDGPHTAPVTGGYHYVFGAQLENRGFASSYYPATTSAATRAMSKIAYSMTNEINLDNYTFLAWIKRLESGTIFKRIFGVSAGSSANTWSLGIRDTTHTLRYHFYDSTNTARYVYSTKAINDTEWHLVGVSVDKTNNKITCFVDDTATETSITVSTYAMSKTQLCIGAAFATETSYPSNCLIDNAIFYKNTVINSTEVKNIYLAQKPFYDSASITKVPLPSNVTIGFS